MARVPSPHVLVNANNPLFRPTIALGHPRIQPHSDAGRVVGRLTAYCGREHPYLVGQVLVVVAVLKDALRAEEHTYLATEEQVRAAGGVGPYDRVEVAPWLPEAGRLSFATSDPKATDLDAFAHG